MEENSSNFHLPLRVTISLFFIILWAQLFWFVNHLNSISVIIILINMMLCLIGVWYISVLRITEKGIYLYRINKLVWSEIVEAHKYSVLGLPYIYIKRSKGMAWSFPLYFIGSTTMKEALLKHVPTNNSLREIAYEL